MPLLQVALDFISEKEALKTAEKIAEYADILEAGTPLIKASGISIVQKLKGLYPNKYITADTKTADAGKIEAKLAFDNGADIITVLWGLQKETVEEVIQVAKEYKKRVIVDLLKESLDEKDVLLKLSPDYLGIHVGIDQQKKGQSLVDRLHHLKNFPLGLAVAGGINPETIPPLKEFNVEIVIVGSYITKSPNPKERAMWIKNKIIEVWNG